MSDPPRLNPDKVRRFLHDLVDFGFTLPRDIKDSIVSNPPRDVESLVDAVFAAEGLDARFRGPLYRQIKDRVIKLFADADRLD